MTRQDIDPMNLPCLANEGFELDYDGRYQQQLCDSIDASTLLRRLKDAVVALELAGVKESE